MLVGEVMTHGIERVRPTDSIQAAAQRMLEHDIGMVLVEDEQGEMVGVLTDRDITCRAVADGQTGDSAVQDYMTPDPVSCHMRDDLYDAIMIMEREKLRRLLVRNLDEKPVGVIGQADVAAGIASYGLASEMIDEVSKPGGQHSH